MALVAEHGFQIQTPLRPPKSEPNTLGRLFLIHGTILIVVELSCCGEISVAAEAVQMPQNLDRVAC